MLQDRVKTRESHSNSFDGPTETPQQLDLGADSQLSSQVPTCMAQAVFPLSQEPLSKWNNVSALTR